MNAGTAVAKCKGSRITAGGEILQDIVPLYIMSKEEEGGWKIVAM